jgi:two-component system chemotaxis response regulator CheB
MLPIRVLIVDDSTVSRQVLIRILSSDPDLTVIGEAADGATAIRMAATTKPDIIVMDILMPVMNGFDATRTIMENFPVPIIIVSAIEDPKEVGVIFHAMQAGALACMKKPSGPGSPAFDLDARDLIQTMKSMAEIKVVRRRSLAPASIVPVLKRTPVTKIGKSQRKIVAIGVSTGGPAVLHEILSHVPKDFPLPIVIVQHIAGGFYEGFSDWLGSVSGYPVRLGTDKCPLLPGIAYIAPEGHQTGIDSLMRIRFLGTEPENGLRPSVAALFRSLAENWGKETVAILLTGMGSDGARELRLLKDKGALTIVQDKESAVVYGMPGEAVRLNAAAYVLSPEGIADLLRQIGAISKAVDEKIP